MSDLIPTDLRWWCSLCRAEVIGVEAVVGHLETVHGQRVQRWPDGGVVVYASEVAELIDP